MTLAKTAVCAVMLCGASALSAQGAAKIPKWRIDPYTRNQPEAMRRMGYTSFAPVAFGQRGRTAVTSDDIDEHLHYSRFLWVETRHFIIGTDVGTYKIGGDKAQKRKVRAELTEMKQRSGIKKINPKSTRLGPWLRLHLYAQRLENHYARMQYWLDVRDMDFPAGPSQRIAGEYRGEGPYLGQRGKFLTLICEGDATLRDYLRNFVGTQTTGSQRWLFQKVDSLLYAVAVDAAAEDQRLRDDTALHANMVFGTTHNMLDGLRHYNYHLPVWINEGLAHYFERLISEKDNTFTKDEGTDAEMGTSWRWKKRVKELIVRDEMAPFSELMTWREFGQIDFAGHLAIWSRWDYLTTLGPGKLGAFLGKLKSLIDVEGAHSNSHLVDETRTQLRKIYGLNPLSLDIRWREWVRANY